MYIHLHVIFPECQEIKKFISPKFDSLENRVIGVKSSPEKPFLIMFKTLCSSVLSIKHTSAMRKL